MKHFSVIIMVLDQFFINIPTKPETIWESRNSCNEIHYYKKYYKNEIFNISPTCGLRLQVQLLCSHLPTILYMIGELSASIFQYPWLSINIIHDLTLEK